jgi:hypothetical protein
VTVLNLLIVLLVGIQAAVFTATLLHLNHQGGAGAESVRILWTKQRRILSLRWLTAGAGVVLALVNLPPALIILPYILVLTSEVLGRFLFYAFYQRSGY